MRPPPLQPLRIKERGGADRSPFLMLTRNRTSLDRSRDCRSGHMISTCQDRALKGRQISYQFNFRKKAAKLKEKMQNIVFLIAQTSREHPEDAVCSSNILRISPGYIPDKVCY